MEKVEGLLAEMAVGSWSAPLPRPEDLKAYNEAQPDASERILQMAERQQRIHSLELILSFGLIALGILGAILRPGGASSFGNGVLPIAAGLAIAVINLGAQTLSQTQISRLLKSKWTRRSGPRSSGALGFAPDHAFQAFGAHQACSGPSQRLHAASCYHTVPEPSYTPKTPRCGCVWSYLHTGR